MSASAGRATCGPSAGLDGLGDLVIVLLASTLGGLSERLFEDGYVEQADLVTDLVELTDDYLERAARRS